MAANGEMAAELLRAGSAAVATVALEQDPETAGMVSLIAGIGFALLDVADAIREQATAPDLGGIRDDLAEIGHAIRHHGSGG